MAGAEATYTIVNRGTVFLPRGRACVSSVRVERDGAVVAPTEADCTYQLVDAAGVEVASPSVDVGVDGIASVSLTAVDLPSTLTLGVGYAEWWGLELDGVVRPFQRQVVVSRFELYPPISHDDLVREYPDILVELRGFDDNLQGFMDKAWEKVCREIVRMGDFPDVICESSDVYDWYEQVVWEKVFRALAKSQASNQRWKELWDYHQAQVDIMKRAVRFLPDRDRDGIADTQARESVAKSYHINVPPNRFPRRDPRW